MIVLDLGRRPYLEVWELQRRLAFLRHRAAIPDLLLLVEHDPVITLGKMAGEENIVASQGDLARLGVGVYRSDRGGDVTFHGPGQLVAYPIMDLSVRGKDAHGYCRDLEEVGLEILRDYGLEGRRVKGLTGVWVGKEKVMAIGVAIRRWIAYHGLALNVNVDLEWFRLIHPCGIKDGWVTSLRQLLGRQIPWPEVKDKMVHRFSTVFEVNWDRMELEQLEEALLHVGQEAPLVGAKGTSS
jgi:lipoate-protein ligase B